MKTQKNIVLIGYNNGMSSKYLPDIVSLGCHPVVLLTAKDVAPEFAVPATLIREQKTYQKTLALVKSYKPLLVLAGDELLVGLSTRLQNDLHLPGNDYKYIKDVTEKGAMHEALKKSGVRYIRGEIAHSVKEALAIYRKFKVKEVVIKPVHAYSSIGVAFCGSEEELKTCATDFFTHGVKLFNGQVLKDELLVQERIRGLENYEYFINTISRNGKHRILQIWQYDFVEVGKNAHAFACIRSVNHLDIAHTALVNYCKAALDALHIVDGPAHTEFFVDLNGPVMVEVNCRISGGRLTEGYNDAIFGHHDTDQILNALLFPKSFHHQLARPYRAYYNGIVKFFIAPADFVAKSFPALSIVKRLRSFYDAVNIPRKNNRVYKTIGFSTNNGLIRLLHRDANIIEEDNRLLHSLERYFFYLLYENGNHQAEDIPPRVNKGETGDDIAKEVIRHGLTLMMNDSINTKVPQYVTPTDIKHVKDALDNFAFGVVNFKKSYEQMSRQEFVEGFLTFADKIRTGGMIIVSERSCNLFPYGASGVEILLKVAGFKIVMPLKTNFVCAVKEDR
ncbi:MAG: ATP-grasp domain-containing protein [Bacilli bacterium]|nr:ATP-grasp domain-containing protein [Bacilli bacterium]